MKPGEVIKRFGIQRGLQIIGFCHLWRSMGSPSMETLTAEIRQQFAAQGLQKSTAYRYIEQLRVWAEERGQGSVEELLAEIAAAWTGPEEETFQEPGKSATIRKQARA